jgi:acetyl esterase/lipase
MSAMSLSGLAFALVFAAAAPEPDPTKPVLLTVPGMDRVRVRKNVVYERVGGEELLADVYLPPESSKDMGTRPPVVVFQAGGAENTKDWASYTSLGRLCAASGFAAVAFNHRLRYPQRRYAEGAEDLRNLLEMLRRDGASLGLDGSRVAVATFSGGGPMLAPLLRQPPPSIRALAGFYSFLDTEHVKLDEAEITAETARAFSPLRAMESATAVPPLFIARAGKDAIPGVNPSIDRFVAKALERNLTMTVVNHPSGAHGFDHRDDDVRTREILEMALAFFRAHLAPVRGAASLPK